jgi:hypothetical protein
LKELYLNFYNFKITLKCESEKIINLIKKDFHYFVVSEISESNLEIEALIKDSIEDVIPVGLISKKQNSRAITFQEGDLRYNFFYGKAVSVVNYKTSKVKVFSKTEGYLHELLYLVILSRQTKFHDINGLHKVHAFGITKYKNNLIGMMDSKGGKTTLFTYFIDQEGVDIISDDTPFIDFWGRVNPFPIRVGFELNSYSKERLIKYKDLAYHFDREEYDAKKLIDILEFQNKISENTKLNRNILFQGIRINEKESCSYKKISKLKMLRYLQKNMIVGVGLPMVLEYYLESSFQDKIRNIKILFSRIFAAVNLLLKSDCYEVYIGFNPQKNYEKLNELLELYK